MTWMVKTSLWSMVVRDGDGGGGGGGGMGGLSGRGGGAGDTGIGGPGDVGGPGRGSADAPGGYGTGPGSASSGGPAAAANAPTATVAPKATVAPISKPTVAPKAYVAPPVAVTPKAPVVSHLPTANVVPTTTTLSPVTQTPTTLSPVNSTTATFSPVNSVPAGYAAGYAQAAATMSQAGVTGVGGRQAAGAPGGKQGPADAGPGRGASIGGPAAGTGPTGTGAGRGNSPGGPGLGTASESGGRGPASSSPAGGAQAAAGYADGSRGGMNPDFGGSSPAAGAQAAGGYTDGSRELGLAAALGVNDPSARSAEDASMKSLNDMMAPTQRAAEDESMGKHNAIQGLLSAIRSAEASKNVADPYNSVVYDWVDVDLQNMTIAEVQALQAQILADQKAQGVPKDEQSTAIGAYQTIASTLAGAVKSLGINPNTTNFSKAVQDQIALSLIDSRASRAVVDGKVDASKFAAQLSKEWAGLANETGRSTYAGVGKNAATLGYDAVLSAAEAYADAYGGQPGSKSIGRGAGRGTNGFAETPTDNAPTPTANPNAPTAANDGSYVAPGEAAVFGRDANNPMSPTAPNTTTAPADIDMMETQSIGRQIAAGVIDAALGLAGPIGMMNAGMGLMGKGTFGSNVVDGFMSGQTPAVDNNAANYGGGGLAVDDRVAAGAPTDVVDPTEKAKPVQAFVSRYLVPRRDYQTPEQKWGRTAA